MKVELDSIIYVVTWRYEKQPNDSRILTTCFIFALKSNKTLKEMSRGMALQSTHDTHNKNTARKISLERALKKLFVSPEDYNKRSIFWDNYYQMRNKKW